ncbi:erythroblast NAD(P)(+)--arginine ADP-ribosyltransferase-like [Sylvia borin]
MAPLVHTLALLAMAVATMADDVFPLDMAQDSFDDQYQGCRPAMIAALPALNRSEFQKNPVLEEFWPLAVAQWQKQGSLVSPLPSPDHAIAIMASMKAGVYLPFYTTVPLAGRSPQEYQDNFHFKTLHFLLTDALATLRDAQKGQCLDVVRRDCYVQYKAKLADTIRFGRFAPMFLSDARECPGKETLLQVHTCHGAKIQYFTEHLDDKTVLIPPFETFKVTDITQKGDKTQIQLRSTGTFSKYNCELLKGGSISIAPFHLGGFLLATTALALATGIL